MPITDKPVDACSGSCRDEPSCWVRIPVFLGFSLLPLAITLLAVGTFVPTRWPLLDVVLLLATVASLRWLVFMFEPIYLNRAAAQRERRRIHADVEQAARHRGTCRY